MLIKIAFKNGALIVQLILFQYVAVAVLGASLLPIRRHRKGRVTRRIYLLAGLSGIAMILTFFFTFAAFQIGDVALVTPINQLAAAR